MKKSSYEMYKLQKKDVYFKNLSDYLAKRVEKIAKLHKFGFATMPSFYKVDLEKEYAKFLKNTNTQPDEKFDAEILASLKEQIEINEVKGCEKSIEAMFAASVRCLRNTQNEIVEFLGVEL